MVYPATASALVVNRDDNTPAALLHSDDHNKIDQAINRIEAFGPVLNLATLADSSPVANTTTETVFSTTLTIDAGLLNRQGLLLRLRGSGTYDTVGSTPTLRMKAFLGSLELANIVRTTVASQTNAPWLMETELVIRSTGASGAVLGHGSMYGLSAARPIIGSSLVSSTLDLTAAQIVSLKVTWSTANAGQSTLLRCLSARLSYPPPAAP